MTAMTDYLENELLDHALGTGAFTAPTNVYVKLHVGAPGETATANAAAETTRVLATFGAASAGSASSSAAVTWTNVSTTETYTHISIWDNLTAGNALFQGAMTAGVAVTAGDDFEFATGQLSVTFD